MHTHRYIRHIHNTHIHMFLNSSLVLTISLSYYASHYLIKEEAVIVKKTRR